MTILRHGYATAPARNGSTRAYRKARAIVLATATHCHICGQPARPDDPFEADHVIPHADGGASTTGNMRACHRTCNRRRGRLSIGGEGL